jgi:hypothetical protein
MADLPKSNSKHDNLRCASYGGWPTQARVWLEWGSSTVRGEGLAQL